MAGAGPTSGTGPMGGAGAVGGAGAGGSAPPGGGAPYRRVALALAVVAGVMMCVQSRMNGALARAFADSAAAAWWSFGSGLVLITGTLVVPSARRGLRRLGQAVRAGQLRWWQLVGGVAGGMFVAVQSYSVPLLGVALFSVAVVGGQTASALLVDRLGLAPGGSRAITPVRLLAAACAVGGVAISSGGLPAASVTQLVAVALAVLVAAWTAVQQATNAAVKGATGSVTATTWLNFVTGSAALLGFGLARAAGGTPPWLASWQQVQWWMLGGGVCGMAFIAIAAWAVKHTGVLAFSITIMTSQVVAAVAVDTFGDAVALSPTMIAGTAVTVAAGIVATFASRSTGQRLQPRSTPQ